MEDEIQNGEAEYQLFIDNQMNDASFVEQLNKMPLEEQEAFKRKLYADYATQEALATEELGMAAELRGEPTPEGRTTNGVYVAANPLEHLARGIGDYKASGMRDDARADLLRQGEDKSEARNTVAGLTQAGASAVQGANAQQQQNIISAEQQQAMADALRLQKQEQQFGIAT